MTPRIYCCLSGYLTSRVVPSNRPSISDHSSHVLRRLGWVCVGGCALELINMRLTCVYFPNGKYTFDVSVRPTTVYVYLSLVPRILSFSGIMWHWKKLEACCEAKSYTIRHVIGKVIYFIGLSMLPCDVNQMLPKPSQFSVYSKQPEAVGGARVWGLCQHLWQYSLSPSRYMCIWNLR